MAFFFLEILLLLLIIFSLQFKLPCLDSSSLLLLLIPFVNIYAIIKINISLAKSFNKSTGFGIGLLLLPIIFVPLLAFSEEEDKKQPIINNNFNAMNIINENNLWENA